MTWTVLLPAIAVVASLVSLSLALRHVDHEMASLRVSLRRTTAAAVAVDELQRVTAEVASRTIATEADARRRIHRPRSRRRRGDR